MTTVWNKLTSHISHWFADEKRGSGYEARLRPSCSLSQLNHKNLRVVRSSKSSENLHRIQQYPLFNASKQFRNGNTNTPGGQIQAPLARYNTSVSSTTTAPSATSPSTSSQCSSGLNITSGYSTNTTNGGSSNIRKKSIGSEFFQSLRITRLKKTFSTKSPDHGPPSQTNSQIRHLTFADSSSTISSERTKTKYRARNSNRQKRSESVSKDVSIDVVFNGECCNGTKASHHYGNGDISSDCNDNGKRSSLFHTLPMSMSWHSNLNSTNSITSYLPHQNQNYYATHCQQFNKQPYEPRHRQGYPSLLNNWYFDKDAQLYDKYASRVVTVKNNVTPKENDKSKPETLATRHHDAAPLTSNSLRRFAAGLLAAGPQKRKPKRSRSVGVVRSECMVQHKNSAETYEDRVLPHQLLLIRARAYQIASGISMDAEDVTSSNAVDALVYDNRRAIDANFLAFTHKDHPVLNNDRMFRRLEKLGEGSYATVYKSENKLDGSIVALKEIKLQPQEGLPFTAIREISLLRGLKHANIICLHQIIHQPQSLILVFEYVKTDLSKFMEQKRCLGESLEPFLIKILLFQLMRGLAFCHERQILHRDLKPQNLLVSEDGELKLADFGLARAKSVPCRTFSHDVVTLWYRPPDVLLGSTHYSTSLDMWGVGCIFAEMCSGVALFPGVNDAADQLERIFSIRGLPDEKLWPEVKDLPNYEATMRQLQYAYRKLNWRSVDAQLAKYLAMDLNAGEELLETFLQMNPSDRVAARDAMNHRYFKALPAIVHILKPSESVIQAIKDHEREQNSALNACCKANGI